MLEKPRMREGTSEAVFIIDEADIVISCNKAAGDMFGWSPGDMEGKKFFDIVLPEDARKQYKDYLHNFDEVQKKGFLVKGIEQKALHRDGYEFPVELNFGIVYVLFRSIKPGN
jgi:PAS domain S-box-containing protein